jgi:ADP-ribose pyrophosphatase YjhB (NUDIX family)
LLIGNEFAVDEALAQFLDRQTPVTEETERWGELPLRITAYLAGEEPPSQHVTSVRGLVVREESVLVLWDHKDKPQLLPGGRREAGETFRETLYREVLEETGIVVSAPILLGFLHYHHCGPQPAGYAYPYPDFLQVVYMARAGEERPEAMVHDEFVTRSAFVPLADVQALRLRTRDRPYLAAALARISAKRP